MMRALRLTCVLGRCCWPPAQPTAHATRSRRLRMCSPTSRTCRSSRASTRRCKLSAVPRGNAEDRDDAGSDAAPRGSADREAVRHPRATARWWRWRRREASADTCSRVDRDVRASGRHRRPLGVATRISSAAQPQQNAARRPRAMPSRRRRPVQRASSQPRGTAGSDRALRPAARRISRLRAQRQGAVSEVPRVRRARPYRRGHGRRWSV